MQSGLNFYQWPLIMILSFVSFWGTGQTLAQAAEKEKDEFSIFDDAPADKNTPANKEKMGAGPAAKTPAKDAPPVTVKPPPPSETPAQKIERLKAEIRRQPNNIPLIEQLADVFYIAG